MITLKDFVKETLSQVVEAMAEFADEKSGTGANPNPPLSGDCETSAGGFIIGPYDDEKQRHDTIMPIEFDVAISAEDSEAKEGGGSVRVMSFFKADGSIAKETRPVSQ